MHQEKVCRIFFIKSSKLFPEAKSKEHLGQAAEFFVRLQCSLTIKQKEGGETVPVRGGDRMSDYVFPK
ncbi:MAG TPA: hypothetical protein DD454_02605 [Candidatus Moranbacteria bacterium]|nr:hypothetical protein [Candidatus Moranbacteria bacterium]